jgi:hypothetical protein
MSFTRSLIKFWVLIFLFCVQAHAQYYTSKAITKSECLPLNLRFMEVASVIKRIQNRREFPALREFAFHQEMQTFEKFMTFQEPPAVKVDENSEAVKLVRSAFENTQKLLFGEQKPFRLSFCERCDLHPRTIDELVIYVDIRFIENLIKTQDKNLVDLDLAHAFSHYVLEVYLIEERTSPGGSVTKYLDWLQESMSGRKFTIDEKIMARAKYHAEVDAIAAGILVMLKKDVPDFSPIVDMYRINRFKNNSRRPITPYDIYVDQEVRVNTLKWIIENWPAIHPSGSS